MKKVRQYRLAKCDGMTLVELLVAMSIFALIAAGGWQLLSQLRQTQQQQTDYFQHMNDINRVLTQLDLDILAAVERAVIIENNDVREAVDSRDYPLALSTISTDYSSQGQPLSSLRRVAYQLEQSNSHRLNKQLVRLVWQSADRSRHTQLHKTILLEDVTHFDIVFIDNERNSHSQWPLLLPAQQQEPEVQTNATSTVFALPQQSDKPATLIGLQIQLQTSLGEYFQLTRMLPWAMSQ